MEGSPPLHGGCVHAPSPLAKGVARDKVIRCYKCISRHPLFFLSRLDEENVNDLKNFGYLTKKGFFFEKKIRFSRKEEIVVYVLRVVPFEFLFTLSMKISFLFVALILMLYPVDARRIITRAI